MGDLHEFATIPAQQLKFYEIPSNSITFSVKCGRKVGNQYLYGDDKPAAVGLSQQPDKQPNFWIVLKTNQCWLEKDGVLLSTVKNIPNILNGDEYSDFWISWKNTQIQFGRTSDGVPLISKKISERDNIKFISFATLGDRGIMRWKFYVPPTFEKPFLKGVTGGEMHWVKLNRKIPDGAFIGGHENEILYIMRSYHEQSLIPNKFVPSKRFGYISIHHEVLRKKEIEILCGYNCIWVPTRGNMIPIGALVSGYDQYSNEKLYIGRAFVDGNLIPGKVQPSFSLAPFCFIQNKEQFWKIKYEILVRQ